MLTFFKRFAYILIGSAFLAACAPNATPLPNTSGTQSPGANVLAGTKWMLLSFGTPGQETPVIPGSAVTLEFGTDGQAGGSGGCNSFGASYQVQGDSLTFGPIVSTMMACQQNGIDEQESSYYQALKTASRFKLAGDLLTIYYDNGQSVLNFQKSTGSSTETSALLL